MNSYFNIEKNGLNIRCKLYGDEASSKAENVIVFCHGFAGHKDNGTAEALAAEVMSRHKNTAVLVFNMPCHGDDTSEIILLENCICYLEAVIDYAQSRLHAKNLYAFGISFGGYLLLKYIKEKSNPFEKVFLRCPAVNMHEVLTKTIMTADELETAENGQTVPVGFDRKTNVSLRFLKELKNSDIRTADFSQYKDDICIMHGTDDEIVPYEAARSFTQKNSVRLITANGADHRFQNEGGQKNVVEHALAFYKIR